VGNGKDRAGELDECIIHWVHTNIANVTLLISGITIHFSLGFSDGKHDIGSKSNSIIGEVLSSHIHKQ
jgi:hypothetical protein